VTEKATDDRFSSQELDELRAPSGLALHDLESRLGGEAKASLFLGTIHAGHAALAENAQQAVRTKVFWKI
jgi:hypothetical protein